MKIYITHSKKWNYQHMLYEPLKNSEFSKKHEIFFPHDLENKNENSKKTIETSDYIIAEVSLPSTGMGIELGWAEDRGIPILCVSQEGYYVSGALNFITNQFIQYNDREDLVQKIERYFEKQEKKIKKD